MKVSVIGAGSWGTVLSQILNDNGHDVLLWARNKEKAAEMNASRCNADYLPDLKLADNITVSNDLELAVKTGELLVLVVPAKGMRQIIASIGKIADCSDKIILSCTKGFDLLTMESMSTVIRKGLPLAAQLAVMSGPNLAVELSQRQPAATVIASSNEETVSLLQGVFINSYFRPYTSNDVLGVELCGSLKNTIALVSGMLSGLHFGENSEAALITRGLAEITRLGVKIGAQKGTFSGLAGVGDLIATCTSSKSRNHRAGLALAQGKTAEEIIASTHMVIEGIDTTKAIHALAKKYNVEMPISEALFQVLFQGLGVNEALNKLMNRTGKQE